MDWKLLVKPAVAILDTMLDGLIAQIKSGNTQKAIDTIEQVRQLLRTWGGQVK